MLSFLNDLKFGGFRFGPFYVHSWGIFASLGVLAAYWVAKRKVRKFFPSLEEKMLSVTVFLLLMMFLGARIFYIVESFRYYQNNLGDIFKVWQGGFSFFGGVIGLLLGGGMLSSKINSLFPVLPWEEGKSSPPQTKLSTTGSQNKDSRRRAFLVTAMKKAGRASELLGCVFTPAWLLGLFWGRVGCFLIHDHPGKNVGKSLVQHEPALYEALAALLLFWLFQRRENKSSPSVLAFPFSLAAYSFVRFWLDFLRALPEMGGDERYGGLTVAQYFSLLFFVFGTAYLVRLKKKEKAKNSPAGGS